jgi:hypothetical protein
VVLGHGLVSFPSRPAAPGPPGRKRRHPLNSDHAYTENRTDPANEHEYEPLLDLVEQGETVIADKGLWGRAYSERMTCSEVELLTPARERTAANHCREHALASTRLVIESVFSNLKEQMRLKRHLAKTPRGLAQRIAQRLLALTLGILLNTLAGRPARALAAYDGR